LEFVTIAGKSPNILAVLYKNEKIMPESRVFFECYTVFFRLILPPFSPIIESAKIAK
jgi:hypothetical protein